jgi:4Fe-4S ferredoxin
MGLGLTLHKFLLKTDCKKCGKKTCLSFAIDLPKGKVHVADCPVLNQPEFLQRLYRVNQTSGIIRNISLRRKN